MGDDIGSGLSSMAVCFDFRLTNVVQLSNRNPSFTGFDVITQLNYLNGLTNAICLFRIDFNPLFIYPGRRYWQLPRMGNGGAKTQRWQTSAQRILRVSQTTVKNDVVTLL